jgi:hypothetical protein
MFAVVIVGGDRWEIPEGLVTAVFTVVVLVINRYGNSVLGKIERSWKRRQRKSRRD